MKSKQKNKEWYVLKNELQITAPFITVFDKTIAALQFMSTIQSTGMLKPMKVLVNNQELKL